MLTSRTLVAVAGVALAAGLIVGCAPEETPPEPSGAMFATEEEAYAAAEEVYRAYNEALNAERAGDVKGNSAEFVVGSAARLDLEAERTLESLGLRLEGDSRVIEVLPVHVDLQAVPQSVEAVVCMDWSKTRVLDSEGADVTPEDRADTSGLEVTFVVVGNDIKISDSQKPAEEPC